MPVKKRTTQQIIEKAKQVHGDTYSYEKAEYIDKNTKMIVTCKIHGDFYQLPTIHLRGHGCYHCGMIAGHEKLKGHQEDPKLQKSDFITKAREVHGDLYCYDKVFLYTRKDMVTIICNIHGEFSQRAASHLSGCGCQKCGKNVQTLDNENLDSFLNENSIPIKRIGNYVNSKTKVELKCLKCNKTFHSTPNDIKSGNKCPYCRSNRKHTNEDIDNFIKEHDLQLIRLTDYVNDETKITCRCLKCEKEWSFLPQVIKQGRMCPFCCNHLKDEKRVGEVFVELGIDFKKIHIELENGRKLFPDYHLPSLNCFVEYNGKQHYTPVKWSELSSQEEADERFKAQKERDEILRQYCLNHNINLIEIDGRKYTGHKLKTLVRNYFKGLELNHLKVPTYIHFSKTLKTNQ